MTSATMSPPSILAVLPGIDPSCVMYVIKPMLELQRRGVVRFRLCLQPYFRPACLRGADLVQFCRNVDPRYGILEAVLQSGLPYTYDLDDDLFNVPAGTKDGQYYNDPAIAAYLERYLHHAALVRVYSQPLFERAAALNPNVVRLRSLVDLRRLHPVPRDPTAPVKIVYATSRRDDHLYPIFAPALLRLLDSHPQVRIYFWGFIPPAFEGRPQVTALPYEGNYDAYQERFSRMGFDIGLAPLLDDPFHQAKTDTKFREYGACAIAGVYSNVPLYAESVEHGVTGLLAENTPDAWYAALARLVDHPAERQTLGAAARHVVEERYAPERFLTQWQHHIQSLLAPASHPSTSVKSVPQLAAASADSPSADSRLRRALSMLKRGESAEVLLQFRSHARSLWWQFKINRMKRL